GSAIENLLADRVCAFLPAAGYGKRMQPLTEYLPKPSLEFLGYPMLHWIIYKVVKSGIFDLAVNIHHLPKDLNATLDGIESKIRGLRLFRSLELPEILDTGGSHLLLKNWRADRTVL